MSFLTFNGSINAEEKTKSKFKYNSGNSEMEGRQAATDSVEVADCHLMPMAVIDLNGWQRERSNASHVRTKRERELDVTVNDLQRDKVMLLVVATDVEQQAIPLLRRNATTHTHTRTHLIIHQIVSN